MSKTQDGVGTAKMNLLNLTICRTIALAYYTVCIVCKLHLLMHYYLLLDVIKIAIDELFKDLDESVMSLPETDQHRLAVKAELRSRIGQIVRWHQSVYDSVGTITSVYGAMLVYQVMFSSVIICLMAYQVAIQMSDGKFNYIFAILTFGAVVQLWIPCCIGTMLQTKASALGDHLFYTSWYKTTLAQLVRQDLIIFIMRTQIPVEIKFTGIPPLDLTTFSSIMTTAYSYFMHASRMHLACLCGTTRMSILIKSPRLGVKTKIPGVV